MATFDREAQKMRKDRRSNEIREERNGKMNRISINTVPSAGLVSVVERLRERNRQTVEVRRIGAVLQLCQNLCNAAKQRRWHRLQKLLQIIIAILT